MQPPAPPDRLPFLAALSWSDHGDLAELKPEEALRRYEAGWRWRGVLAEPSPEELEYLRELAACYGTVIRDLDAA